MPFRISVATNSLGRHRQLSLVNKLEAAAAAGFEGIELVFEDLQIESQSHDGTTDRQRLLSAAEKIKEVGSVSALALIYCC
jgi:sugar phosphate isomerase/epimerase